MNDDLTNKFHDDEVDWLRREADAADERAELYKEERDHYKERADHLLQDRNRLQAALREIRDFPLKEGAIIKHRLREIARKALEGQRQLI